MAFGSTIGVLVEPLLGWRALFGGVALLGGVVLVLLRPHGALLGGAGTGLELKTVIAGYRNLLGTPRGLRTYGYVLFNGIFHSGVYTWLGTYFAQRYQLGEIGIGLALLGYGVPGFVLGPVIGRLADRWGRRRLIPAGMGVAAVAALLLAVPAPLIAAALAVTVLSLGYDMTQPLLAGIVTQLAPERPGQAMGLNVFCLFTGFGLGSLIFGLALRAGFPAAFVFFSSFQGALALLALFLFSTESNVAHFRRGEAEAFPAPPHSSTP